MTTKKWEKRNFSICLVRGSTCSSRSSFSCISFLTFLAAASAASAAICKKIFNNSYSQQTFCTHFKPFELKYVLAKFILFPGCRVSTCTIETDRSASEWSELRALSSARHTQNFRLQNKRSNYFLLKNVIAPHIYVIFICAAAIGLSTEWSCLINPNLFPNIFSRLDSYIELSTWKSLHI